MTTENYVAGLRRYAEDIKRQIDHQYLDLYQVPERIRINELELREVEEEIWKLLRGEITL